MKDIVIVEDKLKKGISLAQQFKELEKKRSDLEFKVTTVCYFKPNMEAAKEEIEKCGKQEFEVLPVSRTVWQSLSFLQNPHAYPISSLIQTLRCLLSRDSQEQDSMSASQGNRTHRRRAQFIFTEGMEI